MRQRIYAKVSEDLLTRLDTIATEEQRPRSQMVAVLLAEAIRLREFASRMNEVTDTDRARFTARNTVEAAVPVPDENETPIYEPVPVDEPGPRHYHSYGPETFVQEIEPNKGTRRGEYKCSCGLTSVRALDDWSRAAVDRDAK